MAFCSCYFQLINQYLVSNDKIKSDSVTFSKALTSIAAKLNAESKVIIGNLPVEICEKVGLKWEVPVKNSKVYTKFYSFFGDEFTKKQQKEVTQKSGGLAARRKAKALQKAAEENTAQA